MMVSERRTTGAGFWLAGWAAAMVVASLLLRDHRAAGDDKALFVVAMVMAAVPAVRFARVPSSVTVVADVLAAAGLSAIAVATYRIGGLAFLLPTAFILLATLNDRRSGDRGPPGRKLARGVLGGSILLLLVSLFDPGGAVFVVAPLALALIVWSAVALRRAA